MRVLLINTNNFSFGPLKKRIDSNRGLNPPISLAYVAAAIRDSGYHVKILDMDAEQMDLKGLGRYIRAEKPDIVGFSIMLNNLLVYNLLARYVKSIDNSINVVFGGIMVNLFPEYIIEFPWVDFGIFVEGELAFPRLISAIESGKNNYEIPGIIYKQDGVIKKIAPEKPIEDMDSIPFPARDLLNNKKYTSVISKYSPITILFSGRGCQYHCTFCSKPDFWNYWRFASPNYVVNEIEQCLNLGIKEILIYDDVFTAYPKRVKAICNEIVNRGLDVHFDIRTRVDMVNPTILSYLRRAGCLRVNYGVESGDPDMLKRYQKNYTIEQVKKAFEITKKSGMDTLAYFMIGGPGETTESVGRTFRLIKYLDPDYLHLTYVIPYPKTELFQTAIQMKLADENFWLKKENLLKEYPLMFESSDLTKEQILKSVDWINKKFYFRPKFIIDQIKKLRTINQLLNYIKAAKSIIF